MSRVRPAFRVDLKVRVRKADGTCTIRWLPLPGEFDGRSVECALAHAVDVTGEEVRRLAKRPAYDMLGFLGAEYNVINLRFVRMGVEDEDGE